MPDLHREPIDPVRFISNYSSGKMGIALADAAAEYGADVDLVLGPVNITPVNNSVKIINVTTAESMAAECISRFPGCDIAILSAAVADFTPEEVKEKKIKKDGNELILKLKPQPILPKLLVKLKNHHRFLQVLLLKQIMK